MLEASGNDSYRFSCPLSESHIPLYFLSFGRGVPYLLIPRMPSHATRLQNMVQVLSLAYQTSLQCCLIEGRTSFGMLWFCLSDCLWRCSQPLSFSAHCLLVWKFLSAAIFLQSNWLENCDPPLGLRVHTVNGTRPLVQVGHSPRPFKTALTQSSLLSFDVSNCALLSMSGGLFSPPVTTVSRFLLSLSNCL